MSKCSALDALWVTGAMKCNEYVSNYPYIAHIVKSLIIMCTTNTVWISDFAGDRRYLVHM